MIGYAPRQIEEEVPDFTAGTSIPYDVLDPTDNSVNDWTPFAGSPNSDLINFKTELDSKSRDLLRNDGLAVSAVNTQVDSIIGSVLKLNANVDHRALGITRKEARELNKLIEREFRSWADSTECHAAGRMNLHGLARQALRGALYNGDAVTLPHWMEIDGERWKTKLQNIESDRLRTPSDIKADNVIGGIEVDPAGRSRAYYIRTSHPGEKRYLADSKSNYKKIPAKTKWGRRRVIHYFEETRAGQVRGSNIFAPLMKSLKLAGLSLDYEMQSVIVNAMLSVFLESDLPPAVVERMFQKEGAADAWRNAVNKTPVKLGNQRMHVLPTAVKMSSLAPSRPNTAFDAFQSSVIKRIAAGLGLSYEVLLKDFSKSSYASARSTLLEIWRTLLSRREEFITGWVQPVLLLWFEEAVNNGRIPAVDFYNKKHAYTRASWIMSGRGWVDPLKEAKGAIARIENGLSTRQKECAEQGLDWEDVLDQLEIEHKEIETRAPGLLTKNAAVYIEPAEASSENDEVSDQLQKQGVSDA